MLWSKKVQEAGESSLCRVAALAYKVLHEWLDILCENKRKNNRNYAPNLKIITPATWWREITMIYILRIMGDALLPASFFNSKPNLPNGSIAVVFNIFLYHQTEILFLMKRIFSKLSVSWSSGQAIETARRFIYHSACCFCIKYNWKWVLKFFSSHNKNKINWNKNRVATSDISMWALPKQN